MKPFSRLCLAVFALAMGLGGCGNIERRPTLPLSLPEPPPWNSIEMMMMETEIVQVEFPGGEPLPLSALPSFG
jgi:hypothetical protein